MLDPTRDHDIKAVAIGLGRKIARGAGSGGYSALLTTRRYMYDKAQGLSELVRIGLRWEAALLARKQRTNYASINVKYLIVLPPSR